GGQGLSSVVMSRIEAQCLSPVPDRRLILIPVDLDIGDHVVIARPFHDRLRHRDRAREESSRPLLIADLMTECEHALELWRMLNHRLESIEITLHSRWIRGMDIGENGKRTGGISSPECIRAGHTDPELTCKGRLLLCEGLCCLLERGD